MTLIISIHRQMFHQDFMPHKPTAKGKAKKTKKSAKDKEPIDRSLILEFSQQLVARMLGV
jgi:hypothetical protein